MRPDPWRLAGTTVADRYRVDAYVAEGGAGRVYRAQELPTGAIVALKVFKPRTETDATAARALSEDIARERAVLERVAHPAVVQCLGHGEIVLARSVRAMFLVMEWVEGPTLDRWLEGRGMMSLGAAMTLLGPVADALATAHRAGVVHRDLKPHNLVVQETPAGRRVRLLDFGIAKLMQPREALAEVTALTASRNPAFSAAYAAPEQVSGAQTGPWTDVHAMALLLVELVTAKRPYRGTNPATLLREILAAERPTPARDGIDVGAAEPVLARALAARPQERFADMDAFWPALAEAVEPARAPMAGQKTERLAAVTAPPRDDRKAGTRDRAKDGTSATAKPKKAFPWELAAGAGVGVVLAVGLALALLR